MFRSKRTTKMVAVLVMALVLASVTYAFAAANTMPADIAAGDGEVAVTGYTVSNIAFTHNADRSLLDAVSFDISPTPATAQVQLESGGAWYDCTEGATTTCTFPSSVTVLSVTQVRVLATSY